MALDLWFREDIVRIVAGAHAAMRCALAAASNDTREPDIDRLAFTDGYETGFTDALRALSVSFGLARLEDAGGSPGGGAEPRFLVESPHGEPWSEPGAWPDRK